MKFQLIDRIDSIEPGKRIQTAKNLTLAEEYLADHFPDFPVMPGVLMIEAMVQSAAWLVRVEQNWSKSIIVLSTAKNVRYANFVKPGDTLRCDLHAVDITADSAKFKASCTVDSGQTVSARLELRCFNLADRKDYLVKADKDILSELKRTFGLIGGPKALEEAGKQTV